MSKYGHGMKVVLERSSPMSYSEDYGIGVAGSQLSPNSQKRFSLKRMYHSPEESGMCVSVIVCRLFLMNGLGIEVDHELLKDLENVISPFKKINRDLTPDNDTAVQEEMVLEDVEDVSDADDVDMDLDDLDADLNPNSAEDSPDHEEMVIPSPRSVFSSNRSLSPIAMSSPQTQMTSTGRGHSPSRSPSPSRVSPLTIHSSPSTLNRCPSPGKSL